MHRASGLDSVERDLVVDVEARQGVDGVMEVTPILVDRA